MKLWKKAVATASALAMTFTFTSIMFPQSANITDTNAVTDDTNDDWLHTDGNKIVDKDGNPVWITGANWFGFNCGESFPHGLWSADMSDLVQSCADHGINLLRIPVSTELLYGWMTGNPASASGINPSLDPYHTFNPELCNPDGTAKDSLGVFDTLLECCKKSGIKVMVDVHSPDSNNSGHNYELWYGKEDSSGTMVTTDMWIDTWVWMAERYKNDDTLIAFDLKNEPHGKRGYSAAEPTNIAKWDDSTAENNWKYAAERCGKAILDVNPNLLIMIEGIEQYPKTEKGATFATPDIWQASAEVSPWYPAWWGGNLRGVKDYPVDFGNDAYNHQIVYSPHDYGPAVYAQTWFNKDFTTQTLLDDYWYDTWAYINDQNIAPLLMGEWGGFMDGAENQKWMELLRDYMKENMIHHTFWCINPNSGDTGGLLGYDFATWDEEKYGLLEEALWQDENGVYIGLDHQTPLGSNGQSLSDYYGGGGTTTTTTPKETEPTATTVTTTETTKNTTTEPTTTTVTTTGTTKDTTETTVTTVTTVTTDSTTTSKSVTTVSGDTKTGDVNLDGRVNISDLFQLAQYVASLVELNEDQLKVADVNGDNKVNISDLMGLATMLINN